MRRRVDGSYVSGRSRKSRLNQLSTSTSLLYARVVATQSHGQSSTVAIRQRRASTAMPRTRAPAATRSPRRCTPVCTSPLRPPRARQTVARGRPGAGGHRLAACCAGQRRRGRSRRRRRNVDCIAPRHRRDQAGEFRVGTHQPDLVPAGRSGGSEAKLTDTMLSGVRANRV